MVEYENEDYIVGELQALFFENNENFYKVMLVEIEETNTQYEGDEIVITGNFGGIKEGVPYRFIGALVDHPKYGEQFRSDRYKQETPSSKAALISYLSGPQFTGIGRVTAESIVDNLGERTIEKIMEEPECLDNIEHVTKRRKNKIIEVLEEEQGMDHIILKLNKIGLSNRMAYEIYGKYKDETLDVINTNPYKLIENIPNLGFGRADDMAESLGIESDSPSRIQAGIYYAVYTLTFRDGHTHITKDSVLTECREVLEKSRSFLIDTSLMEEAIENLVSEDQLRIEEDKVYLPYLYESEWNIAMNLKEIQEDGLDRTHKTKTLDKAIAKVEKAEGIRYGESQKDAIREALNENIFILTGGPGTGKTTVIKGIVSIYADLNDLSLDREDYQDDPFPVVLSAPTGRAAKKMSETTELPSRTIHSLLGLTGQENQENYVSEKEMINGELLIIDEMSMVDTWLFEQLLQSIPPGMKVILVGDKDQLPSVGPGQVFNDLIQSQQLPKAELTEIYRQDENSTIPLLARDIKNDNITEDLIENQGDRSFLPFPPHQITEAVSQIVEQGIKKGFTDEDIQVLAPMYKGQAGIDALNDTLQEVFNPLTSQKQKEVQYGKHHYRIGDKVLQLVNEPEQNVFNGDIGKIVSIVKGKYTESKKDEMVIAFDRNEVVYPRDDWNKITLGYCISIHKAQGSEFKMVILPLVKNYYRMLKKNILYTAVTRASDYLILCGDVNAYQMAIQNNENHRKTSLKERLITLGDEEVEESVLVEEKYVESYRLTPKMVEDDSVPALIGMEGLSPYELDE